MDKKNVEAIYPLTPMQRALLFHSLHAPAPDPGFLQLRCTLHGRLEEPVFKQAWERVVARHQALRTSIYWKELEEPLQVVFREVELPWQQLDWRGLPADKQEARLESFLKADRERGLVLSQSPVTRFALMRVADSRWRFVWSCHHALLDGWSGSLVLNEALVHYEAIQKDEENHLPEPRPYLDYVKWLQQQDTDQADSFWQEVLGDVNSPTPLPFSGSAGDRADVPAAVEEEAKELPAPLFDELRRLARRHRLTLNTLLQGTWAMLLSAYTGRSDVIYGMTVSGRSIDLPGIEDMVGLFINTLPIRVHVERDASVLSFLHQVQSRQAALSRFEYTPPERVHSCSAVVHQRLYESLLVVENYPGNTSPFGGSDHPNDTTPARRGGHSEPASPIRQGDYPRQSPSARRETEAGALLDVRENGIEIRDLCSGITTNYPLTIVAVPGTALSLHAFYDVRRFEAVSITVLLSDFHRVLECIAADSERTLSDALAESIVIPEQVDLTGAANDRPPAGRTGIGPDFVAPRDALELQLTRIWEEFLSAGPIGIRDDFFDVGGHSLLAVRLLERLDRVLGRKLPLATLFQTSTVESLADALRDEGWSPPWSSLVPIEPEGSKPPLFCLHSYGGTVMFYRNLIRYLDADLPIYGLQAVDLDGKTPGFRSVDEMAAHYVREIQTVQPLGPYSLMSICFGNHVALKMACLLREQGHEVAALIILDSGVSRLKSPQAENRTIFGYNVRRIMKKRRTRELPSAVGRFLVGRVRRLRRYADGHVLPTDPNAGERDEDAPKPDDKPVPGFRLPGAGYETEVFAGRITLIRSSEVAAQRNKDWHLDVWSELAGEGLDAYVVPGGHLTMLEEPYVQALAGRVQQCLDAAYAQNEAMHADRV